MLTHRSSLTFGTSLFAVLVLVELGGCPLDSGGTSIIGTTNSTDKANGGAQAVGTSACSACHSDMGSQFAMGRHIDAGVGCESCHGPGGEHFATESSHVVIDVSRIFVDPSGSQSCAECHSQTLDSGGSAILAADGFIRPAQQWSELKASGGHSQFACTYCHQPHSSVALENGIRNQCSVCHTTQTMAGHGGESVTVGGVTESLTCESCHMPFAGRDSVNSPPKDIGPIARQGDVRTHIFRINTSPASYTSFFTADGSEVALDADGRSAVTVDFVCLRCHNGVAVFNLSLARAAEIAARIHQLP